MRWILRPTVALLVLASLTSCVTQNRVTHEATTTTTTTTATAATQPAPSALPATFINARAIIIVRHADIDVAQKREMGNATPLLPRGQQRAKELAYALKDAGVTRILTTPALRTQETAAVLAKELKITPEIPDGQPSVLAYLARTAKPSDVVLIVQHHSVIPSLMKVLGYPDEPEYTDATEFDRIYVLLPNARNGTYQLFRLRFGGDWHRK